MKYLKLILLISCLVCSGVSAAPSVYSKQKIRREMNRYNKYFKKCFKSEQAIHPELAGKIMVNFEIEGNGSVSSVRITENELNNPNVENCILEKIKTLKFPRPPRGLKVNASYPFAFGQVLLESPAQ